MATETERLARIEGAYEHLATRADVESVRSELKADIQEVRSDLTAEIQSVRSELKADIQEVRTEIQSVRSDMDVMRNELRWLRWLMAIGVAGILLPLLQRLFAFLS